MKDKGFIKVPRRFFSHRMWEAARTFSECEAWIDLIQSARFDATPLTESIGGREITYGRGQYPASIRFLAQRWNWGEQKTRTFLSRLKKEKWIAIDNSQGMSIITLCVYDGYNANNTADGTVNNTAIMLEVNELREQVTHLTTQLATQPQHSDNTNSKKEEEREERKKKESTNVDEKEADASSQTHSPEYRKFQDWMKTNAPYCADTKNFPRQITEAEFLRLKEKYSAKQLADTIEQLENRKDLRKRYTNLYRTVLNWIKKEHETK